MIILGLTGSIAMGKSTAAGMFRRLGIPVHDADQAVHRLLAARGAAVPLVERAFPGVVDCGAIDRKRLGARVFGDDRALRLLERILHPLVAREREHFLGQARRQRRSLVVLDIPLLYETGAETLCDAVVVVSAPQFLQLTRLLQRSNMTRERIAAITARQMPDAQKRRRADFVIPSGLGRAPTFKAIRRITEHLRERPREAGP
ncbi:MAG: dephospho-CoA kinase [Rhodospirillales bacterium]|nr:dephospho-CoA kinase [Rhodospirillales bacterium]